MGLREDRGGGDTGIGRVAVDDGPVILEPIGSERAEFVAVDKQELRRRIQAQHRPLHARDGGPEDVEAVDFRRADFFYGPGDGFALNHFPKFLPGALGHLFRIVQQRMAEVRGQDDGGGEDRSGQRSPSGLVAAGFQPRRLQIGLQIRFHRPKIRISIGFD